MKVAAVLAAEIRGGYFYDDQAAIRAGGTRADGEAILGTPVTAGFGAVRIPGTGVAIGLRLEDGSLLWGDAISVQYPGVAGRDPLLPIAETVGAVRGELAAALAGLDVRDFRAADRDAAEILTRLGLTHRSLAYGLSQALLGASARATGCTMAEAICRDFDLELVARPVPIMAQSGDRRHDNADKMILKSVDALPHGLINTQEKFGPAGETLLEYVRWVAARIPQLNHDPSYRPTLHFDLYGVAGAAFDDDTEAIAAYLSRLVEAAAPYDVRLETPVIADSRAGQIERLRAIRETLARDGVPLTLLADEWCNTLEDILAFAEAEACDMVQIKMPDLGSVANSILAVKECRAVGMGTYLGGSCAETEQSARVAVHVAVATQADVQLAKPGMGVDEGLMIVANEQARLLAELATR